jgi:hypothetical protein
MAKSYSFNANYLIRLANEAIQKTWIIYGYDQIEINSNPENQLMYFSEIVYKRSLYYFGMIRPYFGKMHNIVLMLFYPLYLFAIYGAFLKTKTPRKIKVFVIFVIGAFSGASILTFINWHGRFIAPIIPLILILAAIGVEKIVEQVKIAPKRS